VTGWDSARASARRLAGRARTATRNALPLPVDRDDPRRLVTSPVFLLSSIRSGSTLLRVVLNSHSQICAPHELHLAKLKVHLEADNLKVAMRELELTPRGLENLLWDRILHLELVRSGKSIVVDKTPQNTLNWQRLKRNWPQARYIFLLRHPVRVVESMVKAWPNDPLEQHYRKADEYATALSVASRRLPGVSVRYEDLTNEPERITREICTYLQVPWEPAMIRYGDKDHGRFVGRLGDWSSAIKSGAIQPAKRAPTPEEIPDELKNACKVLGYV
jgi:hypothetical protein